MGNYHHHQNPSAFDLDLSVISTICDLYAADGLYAIDSTSHSPLIGFAYDGFPIYGAYGYKNTDGTGGITRIKSGFQLRNITARTLWADGTDVADGPVVSTTYPLGYFREDYEFVAHAGQEDYLDAHNGRFCITPEYPNGIYCYFATVAENWNSAYPYVVGPYFYGNKTAAKVTSITETVTTYTSTAGMEESEISANVFPNPSNDLLIIQLNGLNKSDVQIELVDLNGRVVSKQTILHGSTVGYIDVSTIYKGNYLLRITSTNQVKTFSIVVGD